VAVADVVRVLGSTVPLGPEDVDVPFQDDHCLVRLKVSAALHVLRGMYLESRTPVGAEDSLMQARWGPGQLLPLVRATAHLVAGVPASFDIAFTDACKSRTYAFKVLPKLFERGLCPDQMRFGAATEIAYSLNFTKRIDSWTPSPGAWAPGVLAALLLVTGERPCRRDFHDVPRLARVEWHVSYYKRAMASRVVEVLSAHFDEGLVARVMKVIALKPGYAFLRHMLPGSFKMLGPDDRVPTSVIEATKDLA
jgi:hypothetical protein